MNARLDLTPVALYARVSSDRQDVDLSVSAQLRALKDYAKANGYSVAREYVDEAESGRVADRPQFREMIEEGSQPKAPFEVILVWKFSRFTRKREHAVAFKSMLRRKGVRVVSITEHADDSPTGKLMEAIIESVDEFYSENLVRLLDERPQWLDAVRARVLTRELIELPQTLARFAAGTNERFDKVEGDIGGLRNDIAPLKGAHVRSAAVREAGLIAEDMGFALVGTLNPEQVRTLSQSESTADIPAGDLRSFRRADLIMEVTDGEGETCYVAVEISFTANGRDTTRAVRNAGFLTAFTGKRSVAAVAGLRRDDRIDESIESGEVFWHQLDPSDLEAE